MYHQGEFPALCSRENRKKGAGDELLVVCIVLGFHQDNLVRKLDEEICITN